MLYEHAAARQNGGQPSEAWLLVVLQDVKQLLLQYFRLSAFLKSTPRHGLAKRAVGATSLGR